VKVKEMLETNQVGKIIKQYREKCHMSQAELADSWPRADGGIGCSVQYVQLVEYGKRIITEQRTLRGLCSLLNIPLWMFGLSEYDPLRPELTQTKDITVILQVAEHWIQRAEHVYLTAPLPEAIRDVNYLNVLFTHLLTHYPPFIREQQHFLTLYAQLQKLTGVIQKENACYEQAVATFEGMYATALELQNLGGGPTMSCEALVYLGSELGRSGKKQEQVAYLEQARDLSFETSKHLRAYAHTYLARAYAFSANDTLRFERAIHFAEQLARSISYGDGTDFIYHPLSGIMAERSCGYLKLGFPEKTLAMRDEITAQIEQDKNQRLHNWIPLDWARAYRMLGEIEASVEQARIFYTRARQMQAPHAIRRAREFAASFTTKGFGDIPVVRELQEEIREIP
jgi:tetratricopeptide (TPR) repeat protein